MDYTEEKNSAITAVLAAATLCTRVQAALAHDDTIQKVDKSPVTIADFGSQALVNMVLMEQCPGDSVVAEEDAGYLRDPGNTGITSRVLARVNECRPGTDTERLLAAIDHGNGACMPDGRFWTLDPIDGTKGFLRGDQYAIALALIDRGRVVLGVLGCPNLPLNSADPDGEHGCLFIAVRGQGAFMRSLSDPTETPVRVNDISDPTRAIFCESVESAHTSHGRSARVAELLGVTAEPFRIDSQCKYAAVARGDASIYMRLPSTKGYQEKIWDHAAGSIVVEEAGGTVTDTHGTALDFTVGNTLARNAGILASNGILHHQLLPALNTIE